MNNTEQNDIETLRQLVAFKSETGHIAETNAALQYISERLTKSGMHLTHVENDGYSSLVATTSTTKTPAIMLVAHVDVVAAPEPLFTMTERDGKLYGRGVWDMKFAIASYLSVADALSANLADYDFGIAITSDEETRDLGVKHLLGEGFLPRVAILPDGSNDWHIESRAKGAMYFTITISGKTAHGSRPWLGDSASYKVVEFLHELRQHFVEQGINTRTLNISALEAGEIHKHVNRIPDRARIGLDIRVLDDSETTHIQHLLAEMCAKYDAVCERDVFFPALVHDHDHPLVTQFTNSVEKVAGIKNEGFLSLGASDAGHFVASGIPCIVTSPTGGDRHSDAEWIDKASFLHMTPILLDYLNKVARR